MQTLADVRCDASTGRNLYALKDVCKLLGKANHFYEASKLTESQKGCFMAETVKGVRQIAAVTTEGLLRLVFTGSNPKALELQASFGAFYEATTAKPLFIQPPKPDMKELAKAMFGG